MTRIAVLYDLHGNFPALEAVLEEVRSAEVDQVVVGGDVVPGPMPAECMDALLSLEIPTQFIMGNGDREVLASRAGGDSSAVPEAFRENIRWCARELTDAHATAMRAWPGTLSLDVANIGRVLFCHATPRNDTDIFTRLTPEAVLLPLFGTLDASMVVCGHTHMQFDRLLGGVRVVNAGSVGMPFGEPGAYWLLIDGHVQFRHTSYDFATAAERVRRTRYPQAQEFGANNVLAPPPEAEVLDAFTGSGLK